MKVLSKYNSNEFKGFDWLDFDYLPNSKGFKFEIYSKWTEDPVAQSIVHFYLLFREFLYNIKVKPFGQNSKWGDFCIDTWDLESDKYDYSHENKEEPTASYLAMLQDSDVEPHYTGFCVCENWDKFLYIALHCIMSHNAPYSMMFYEPKNEFVFYFHHSGSLGIYYKELNNGVKSIINKAKEENLEITNTNDDRIFHIH